MGSSYSRKARSSPSVKSNSSTRSKKSCSKVASSPNAETDHDNTFAACKSNESFTHERKDSKKHWISHVRFRKRSSGDVRRTSSERRPEMRSNANSNLTKQTDRKSSKTGLSKCLSFGSSTGKSSLRTNTENAKSDDGKTVFYSSIVSTSVNDDGLGENSVVATQRVSFKDRSLTNVQLYNILNDGALSPCICDPTYILLIDARSKQEYDADHIIMARHITTVKSQEENIYGISSRVNVSEFTWVVIYGYGVTDDSDDNQEEIKIMNELEECYDTEPFILAPGFKSFQQLYPFLCSQHEKVDFKSLRIYPSIILDEQLYQGRGDQATNIKVVTDLQITHIINITQEHVSAFPEKIQYLTLKLDDVSQTQLIKHFDKTTNFLESALSNGGRVLVHCNLGVSRSSTISIAYLIHAKKWTLQQSHEFLKDKRTCIRPNRGFLKQLAIWEEMKLGKKFTDPDDLW